MSYLAGDRLPADVFYWRDFELVLTSSGTQPSLGNSVVSARYFQLGKLTIVKVSLFIGSTFSAGTGVYFFFLPVESAGGVSGSGYLVDPGTGIYAGVSVAIGTGPDNVQLLHGTSQVAHNTPFSPATGDSYHFTVVYESA